MRLAMVRAHAHVHHLHHLHDGLEHAEVGGERVGGEGPTAPGGRVRVVVDGPEGERIIHCHCLPKFQHLSSMASQKNFYVPEHGWSAHALSLEHVHVGDVLLDSRAGGAEGAARVHPILQS